MKKKQSIFKEFKNACKNNPTVAFAILWVTLMPSIGSLIFVPWALSNSTWMNQLEFNNSITILLGLIVSVLLMGLALMPTTLIAALSGFFMGWQAFPWLVLGYTLATVLGYAWGKGLSGNSLSLILKKYPKAEVLIEKKQHNIGELIFFVRLSPVIPFAMSNLLFALMRSGYWKLVVFGTLGMLPRTLFVFFSGTMAANIYAAIIERGGKEEVLIILGLLILSVWGIWRFFTKKPISA
ncbi:MAG: DedA family protein [Mongoliibacter sp.]|uniref:TVP38/TMEM64 family protein n=1 Tax=Mongoliibacter sp. TaxID=2022438 RepID=UPI0012EF7EAC|nr:VTT domain-containing protein [Mongoliibacter sp.]TVP51776.1 MAG: DedA family protein [Mongoliibacter sp.]